jgi:aromatic ring-opening dioxygenase catalytic subunit (LigB family)
MDPPAGQPTAWDAMAAHLRSIDGQVGRRPKAVLVVSAHWECEVPTVHTGTNPSLLFDYYGFPEHTYRLAYPVQGSPEVAARVALLLEGASIPTATESKRGLDHGVFVPFKLIYPDADVPIVQLSLRVGLSPQEHLEIGRALAPLRDEDVLIVGSGMTSHNLRDGFSRPGIQAAAAFDEWLNDVVQHEHRDERWKGLANWAKAPGARMSHPREEHLLPLMVALGAAGDDPGRSIYADRLFGQVALSGFQFG